MSVSACCAEIQQVIDQDYESEKPILTSQLYKLAEALNDLKFGLVSCDLHDQFMNESLPQIEFWNALAFLDLASNSIRKCRAHL